MHQQVLECFFNTLLRVEAGQTLQFGLQHNLGAPQVFFSKK